MSNASTFGQNQWLVDEMFQQFQRDPQSVDPEWRELFETTGTPSKPTTSNTNPFKQQQPPVTPRQTQAQQTANQPSLASSVQQLDPKEVATKADHLHIDEANKEEKREEEAKKLQQSPLGRVAKLPSPGEKTLKGVYKAIAKNMDESLEIPTATSVRDMPVKLMFENRAIINEHMQRTHGGKVSFTHIIGYALVKALMAHPDLNNHYDVINGKPTVITPEHINLGLAIDRYPPLGAAAH